MEECMLFLSDYRMKARASLKETVLVLDLCINFSLAHPHINVTWFSLPGPPTFLMKINVKELGNGLRTRL